MASIARGMVSMKKVRFQEDGFDLDLTYITPRVIAMGFPSYGMESVYRNPADEVEKFFNQRHKDHYRIYNLCSERKYDKESRFGGRFKHMPFDDHNPPAPISIIPDFINDVNKFLAADERNVVAIHCKAGKGRTGVVITTYLMDQCPEYRAPRDALERFGSLRTHDGKGVTIPSQHRYVGYWDQMIAMFDRKPPPAPPRMIEKITVNGGSPKWDLYMVISEGPKHMGGDAHVMFDSRKKFGKKAVVGGGSFSFDLSEHKVVVRGDVKVAFKAAKRMGSDDTLFHFWFHTCFEKEGTMSMSKFYIDKAAKDEKHEKYRPDLSVAMTLAEAPTSSRKRGDSGLLRLADTGSPKAKDKKSRRDDSESPRSRGALRVKTPSPVPSDTDSEEVLMVDDTPPPKALAPKGTPPRRRLSLAGGNLRGSSPEEEPIMVNDSPDDSPDGNASDSDAPPLRSSLRLKSYGDASTPAIKTAVISPEVRIVSDSTSPQPRAAAAAPPADPPRAFLETKLDSGGSTMDLAIPVSAPAASAAASAATADTMPETIPVEMPVPAAAAAQPAGGVILDPYEVPAKAKMESAAEKRLRELREKREARQREREQAKVRREQEQGRTSMTAGAAPTSQEEALQQEIEARKREMEQKQRERDQERITRGFLNVSAEDGVDPTAPTMPPPTARPPAEPLSGYPLGSPERLREIAERDKDLLSKLEQSKAHLDEKYRQRELGRQSLKPIAQHLLRQKENDFGAVPPPEKRADLDPWNHPKDPDMTPKVPPRIQQRILDPEMYSPTPIPPHSDTQSGADVVELARGIIDRVRAIERSCEAIAARSPVRRDPPPRRFPVPEPVEGSGEPLPLIALSLLQRSARLEIMCSEETEYRDIRSGARRLAHRAY